MLPASHALLAKVGSLTPADFEGEAFISLSADDPYRAQLDEIFQQHGVQRQLRLETHSAVAVCAMVAQGLGIAIVSTPPGVLSDRQALAQKVGGELICTVE